MAKTVTLEAQDPKKQGYKQEEQETQSENCQESTLAHHLAVQRQEYLREYLEAAD